MFHEIHEILSVPRLNEYLAKINVTDSTKCTQCKTAAETVEHFLLNCPNSDLCKKSCSNMYFHGRKHGHRRNTIGPEGIGRHT